MSWVSELFSSSVGEVFGEVGDAIDDCVTSDEERLALKNALEIIKNNKLKEGNRHIEAQEAAITDRHKTDMNSDSWLSKNIRPLGLAFLTVSVVLMAFATVFVEMTPSNLEVLKVWIGLFTTLLVTVYSFYYGSRGLEKVASAVTTGIAKIKGTNKQT